MAAEAGGEGVCAFLRLELREAVERGSEKETVVEGEEKSLVL